MNNSISLVHNAFTSGVIEGIFNGSKDIYNPVLFYGDTRKTSAICKEIAEHFIANNKRVSWTTGQEFFQWFIEAWKLRDLDAFRNMFLQCDILIFEGVDWFSGYHAMQYEFFTLFDLVFENKGQIVLTSAGPPGEITRLDDRVRTQLTAGICCPVE